MQEDDTKVEPPNTRQRANASRNKVRFLIHPHNHFF